MADRASPSRVIASRHGPYLQAATAAAATAYHDHHFACPTCIAAGKGAGTRCADGTALHQTYVGAFASDRSKV